jgi:hypothetical protein
MQSLQNDNNSGILSFVGKRMSKKVNFLDGSLVIYKLTVDQVDEIRKLLITQTEKNLLLQKKREKDLERKAKAELDGITLEDIEDDDNMEDYSVVHTVLKYGADNGANLTIDALKQLPLEELSKLSETILEYSGVKDKEKKS